MSDAITAPDPEELKKLVQLRISGEISEEEFAKANRSTFDDSDTPEISSTAANAADRRSAQSVDSGDKLACFLHVSQLLGYLLPLAGLLLPVIIWFVFKQKHAQLGEHIRNVFNWLITAIIFALGLGILAMTPLAPLALLGIFALVLAGVIFPIIAGIKAFGGEVWDYPLAFKIF